jgi:hypothetical protein
MGIILKNVMKLAIILGQIMIFTFEQYIPDVL